MSIIITYSSIWWHTIYWFTFNWRLNFSFSIHFSLLKWKFMACQVIAWIGMQIVWKMCLLGKWAKNWKLNRPFSFSTHSDFCLSLSLCLNSKFVKKNCSSLTKFPLYGRFVFFCLVVASIAAYVTIIDKSETSNTLYSFDRVKNEHSPRCVFVCVVLTLLKKGIWYPCGCKLKVYHWSCV